MTAASDPFAPCSVDELHTRLCEIGNGLELIDVREADELAIASIPGARHIPLDQIPHAGEVLRSIAQSELLVLCHHGVRSAMACRILRDAGFRSVRNVSGGIDAYAKMLDPSIPRY